MITFIPFSDFAPGPSSFGEGLATAENVVPAFGSLYSFRGLAPGSTTVADGPMTGCYPHIFPAQTQTIFYVGDAITVFAGSKTALYVATTTGFTNVSRGGGYAAAFQPAGWRYESYGNDVWAANGLDIFQRRTNNGGNFADGPTSTFVPRPRFCAAVREFMVVADLSANGVGFSADQFTWSDANDAAWYDDRTGARPASLAGGSVGKTLRSRPGQITGLTGGEYGMLYKRNSSHALQFTGGGDLWRLDEVDRAVGCVLPGSLIAGRNANYFYGGDGFYRQAGLSPAEHISPPGIDAILVDAYYNGDRAVISTGGTTAVAEDLMMVGFESRRSGVVGWLYADFDDGYEFKRRLILHHPASGLWSEGLLRQQSGNLFTVSTLCGLPQTFDVGISPDILRLAAFTYSADPLSALRKFSGENYPATLITRRRVLAFDANQRPSSVIIKGVLPMISAGRTRGLSTVVAKESTPVSVRVTASNSPWFESQADANGDVVSPRGELYANPADADGMGAGWLPSNAVGPFFDITATIASGVEWTTFDGVWLWWEAIS